MSRPISILLGVVLFVSRDADAADLARRVKTAFEPFGKAVEVPVSLAMG